MIEYAYAPTENEKPIGFLYKYTVAHTNGSSHPFR